MKYFLFLECKVGTVVEKGEGFTKKEAKRRAAALMLNRLKIEDIDKQVRDLQIPIGRQVGDFAHAPV